MAKNGMAETKRQGFRSIVGSVAMYGCFLLTLSKVLGFRTSRRGCGRAQLAKLLTGDSDLFGLQDAGLGHRVKLAGVDSSNDSRQRRKYINDGGSYQVHVQR